MIDMKKSNLLLLATTAFSLSMITAFDSGKPAWKLDDAGNIVVGKDGNPTYVNADGQEQTLGIDSISKRNSEAKTNRERAEKAEGELKKFEGIDPELARKAIDTVAKVDAKTLIDAGEVDKVRKEISDQFTAQIGEKDKLLSEKDSRLNNMIIDGVFKDSEFVRNEIAMPRDFFENNFRNNMKIEKDGKIGVYDKSGNRVYSKTNPGEFASPEEGLRLLVESHPQKDTILKADAGSGSGSQGNGGNQSKGRTITRTEFDKLSPAKQAEIAQATGKGDMKIVD